MRVSRGGAADGDVDPDQSVVAGQQLLQLPDRMLLDPLSDMKCTSIPPTTSWVQ